MGGWQNPTAGLVSGASPSAPLSTLLPAAPTQNPDTPKTSSSSNLQFQANSLNTAGVNDIGSGISLLGEPLDYWSNLLKSPTKTSLMEQEGPASSSVVGQYSTGKNALANAPRGGGTNATAAELPFQESGALTGLLQQQLQQYLNVLQPQAANAITGIGQLLSSLGLSEEQVSSGDLSTLVGNTTAQRGQTIGLLESWLQGAQNAAAALKGG